jgi:hypothetical protein
MFYEVVIIITSIVITCLLFFILSTMEKILSRLWELINYGKTCEKLLEAINNNIYDIQFNTSNLRNIEEAICVNSDEPMN